MERSPALRYHARLFASLGWIGEVGRSRTCFSSGFPTTPFETEFACATTVTKTLSQGGHRHRRIPLVTPHRTTTRRNEGATTPEPSTKERRPSPRGKVRTLSQSLQKRNSLSQASKQTKQPTRLQTSFENSHLVTWEASWWMEGVAMVMCCCNHALPLGRKGE